MSRRELERMAAELDAIGRDVFRIRALSRTQPHVFAEEKDALSNRCHALARELRQASGGSPVPNVELAQNRKLTPVLDCQAPAPVAAIYYGPDADVSLSALRRNAGVEPLRKPR